MNESSRPKPFRSAPHDELLPSSPLARRDFLKLVGATTAVAGVAPFLGGPRSASAQRPQSVKVLLEDLRLDAAGLAGGGLDGVAATTAGLVLTSGSGRGQYMSPVLTGRNPFTHIGVHWTATGELSFEVRSSVDGRAWSDWQAVDTDDHGAIEEAETFGALVSADRATRVQFRAGFARGAAGAPVLQSATVTLLNSKDGPAAATLADPPPKPDVATVGEVFSREDWGCDETLALDNNGNELWPPMHVNVKKGFVHHTVTSTSYSTLEDAKAEVRAVHAYHAKTRGWGDIGYNALVDRWGNVYEGRYGRGRGQGATREVLSADVVAGHTLKHNYGSVGVAALWTCTKKGDAGQLGLPPTADMKTGIIDYLTWELGRHHLDPGLVTNFLLVSDEVNDHVHNISGHRDGYPFVSTVCPGGYLYELLPEMRATVAKRLELDRALPTVALTLTPPASSVQTVSLGAVGAQAFSWDSTDANATFHYSLEGWRRQTPESEAIDYMSGADPARRPVWGDPLGRTSATFDELFDAFRSPSFPEPVAGHYTFHVLAVGADGESYQRDHTLLVTPGGGIPPPAGGITLAANGYKVKGAQKVDLTWSGATTSQVAIRRKDNGGAWTTIAANEPNDNGYTDNINKKGGGTYTYQVTEVGSTPASSNEATVTF